MSKLDDFKKSVDGDRKAIDKEQARRDEHLAQAEQRQRWFAKQMANRSSVAVSTVEIVADQLDVRLRDIGPDTSFVDDLQADSLAVVELVLAIEEKFAIKIPDEDVDNIRTVADLIAYIERQAL